MGFPGGSVKNPPTMWETWVQFLGWEDPLEKGIATHSNILAWRIPWTEEPERAESERTSQITHLDLHSYYTEKVIPTTKVSASRGERGEQGSQEGFF